LVNQRRDHYRVYNSQTPVNIPMLLRRDRPGALGPGPRRPPEDPNSCLHENLLSDTSK